jgi:hypothetical protein
MIKLRQDAVFIIHPDGKRTLFEPEELQSRIIRSCLTAGHRDAWFAEDVVLAIESALRGPDDDPRPTNEGDLNALVVRVLADAGLPEVAGEFARQNSGTEITAVKPVRSRIAEIIADKLNLAGDCLNLCTTRVEAACKKLQIDDAAPSLLVELARYYRDSERDSAPPPRIGSPKKQVAGIRNADSPWLLPASSIVSAIDSGTLRYISGGILQVRSVSKLFPSLKIDLSLVRYAETLNLAPPISEMALYAHFPPLATAIDDIARTINSKLAATIAVSCPIVLQLPDCRLFSERFLGSPWPEGESLCREIVSSLEFHLTGTIFRAVFR